LFGNPVQLQSGEVVTVNENYIRESILRPNAKITYGYSAIMPTYQGQINEAALLQLTAYVKSLGTTQK
jgi:cytochrome c oxidase subunit 2